MWGKQTDLIVISNLHQLISNKPAGINPILLSPAQQERCEDVKALTLVKMFFDSTQDYAQDKTQRKTLNTFTP